MDGGLCQRLVGQRLPSVRLSSTAGGIVDLAAPSTGRRVIYCYRELASPGSRRLGLGPDTRCAGMHAASMHVSGPLSGAASPWREVVGLSTQTTAYQAEKSSRLHLPVCRVERPRHTLH